MSIVYKWKLVAIIGVLAISSTLVMPLLVSAFHNPPAVYEWYPGVPYYNDDVVIVPGIIDPSDYQLADFIGVRYYGLTKTSKNADMWGDWGEPCGWDDSNPPDATSSCGAWAGDANTNGDALDGKFVVIGAVPGVGRTSEGWWNLDPGHTGFTSNKVYVQLSQDHGPYLGEGLEFRVYGSNTPFFGYNTKQARLKIVYLDGWRTHNPAEDANGNGWCSDDIAAIFELPGDYRYVRITQHAKKAPYWEPEVDAVAAYVGGIPTPTPSPSPSPSPSPGPSPSPSPSPSPTPTLCTLTTGVVPLGSGTVTPEVGTYTCGTQVTLVAENNPGWIFDHWDGDASGTQNPTTITLDRDKHVVAYFTATATPTPTPTPMPTLCYLTTSEVPLDSGSVEPGPGPNAYTCGTTVDLTATPSHCWSFDHWGFGASGTDSSTTILMDSDKHATAFFVKTQYTLTTEYTPSGAGTVDPGGGTYDCDWPVTITALPAAGWCFDHWEGAASGSQNPITLTMNSNKQVTAHFIPCGIPTPIPTPSPTPTPTPAPTCTLTMQKEGYGSTNPTLGTHSYPCGTTVSVCAYPGEGWSFDSWTGSVANANLACTTVYMQGHKTVTAHFETSPLQLAVVLDGSSSMDQEEWNTQIVGLTNAIQNGNCMPDGSVELTVIQFASDLPNGARTEVPPTVITNDNRYDIAQDVMDIVKSRGITPMEAGIDLAVEKLRSSEHFTDADWRKVIDISSDVGEYTLDPPAIEQARDSAIDDVDEINAIGIGDIRPVDIEWFTDRIVYPGYPSGSGSIAQPFTPGWVYDVEYDDFKFSEAICQGFEIEETHTWIFPSAGTFTKQLPDSYSGQVVLASLDPSTIPTQIEGVWWYDASAGKDKFWVPGAGGELTTLTGQLYEYQVLVTGPCEWTIPLQ